MRHCLLKARSLAAAHSARPLVSLLGVLFLAQSAFAQWRVATPPADQVYSEGKSSGGGMALLSAAGTTVTTNETEATPEIRALARALDNDPKLIYEYVRNHIAYDPPTYGLHNGAHGCLMAGRGNDWDQAALLTSLLRTAGHTTRFGCGLVKYTRADLGDWLGVQADAVTNVIPTGGNPGGRINGDNTNYFMQRVWVETQVGEAWYTFDPAFKTYQDCQRPDLRAAMGYTESAFVSNAMVGATVTTDYVKNANETNIGANLTIYATNLVRYIQTNNPLMPAAELVGGRTMLDETLAAYPTNLPKVISFYETPDTWDHIPSSSNVTLRVQHAGIDKTFKGYDIAAKRLSLYYDAASSNRPQLRLAGVVVATGNATTAGTTNDLAVYVDHPYASADYCDTSNGFHVISGNRYVIMHDFEGISPKVVAAANNQLARDITAGLSTNTESVFAGGLEVTALSGLQQWRLSRQLLGRLSDVVGYAHHFIGIMAQESGYYVDIPGVLVGVNSCLQSNADERAWFKAVTLFASALEHGALEESQGSDKKCASTIKLLQISNTNGKKSYLATSSNWTSTVKPALTNYTTSQKTQIEAGIDAGRIFVLPQDGKITNQQWVGVGYVQYGEDATGWGMGMIISGGYNGAYAGSTGSFNINSSVNTVSTAYTYWPSATVPTTTGADPVDLHTGDLVSERADIVLGNGPDPRGLALVSSYNSGQNCRKTAMGYGWTHSYDIGVTTVSQGDPSFGLRRPEDATPLIVQSIVTLDLMQGTPDVRDWVAASLATKWGMDQVINNSAIVRLGARSLEFVRLPDGSYVPPPGVTTTLRKQGSSLIMEERFGTSYTFNSNGTISVWRDADSNSVSFTYNSSTNLTTVSNSFGRTLSFTYSGGLVTKISDNASRSVSYTYTSSNLTSVLDTGSNSWALTYNTNRCLVTMRDPLSRLTISNTYDSVSKVQSQMNGMGNVWNFYIGGWRGVEEDPQGGRTIHYFDDDGRNLGTQDALSNRTYRFYDGQGHVVSNIDARSYATVLQYDNNHNVTNRMDALTNRTTYTYDSQFHLTSVTDPLGNITRYGYDSKHHVTNIVDALNNVATMSYTSKGLLQQLTEGNGKRTATYTYDNYANQITLARTDGGTVSNQYDSVGNLTAQIDANNRTNRFTWDKRRLLTSDRDPLGYAVTNTFDAAGLLLKTVDRNGNTNQRSYTATYNVSAITNADTAMIRYAYDSCDRLSSVTDPLGHVTSNRYDKAGRKIAVIDALGNPTSFAFDANGNVTTHTNALGHVTHYEFDALNRLTNTWDVLPGGTRSVASVFDAGGRLVASTDAKGYQTQFQYDALNRKTAVIKADGTSEHFEYDVLGNMTAFVNGEGKQMAFVYDAMGRTLTVTNSILNVTRFAYDPGGNRTNRLDATGVNTRYRYDKVNSVTNITYLGASTTVVSYAYDKNRLTTNMTDGTGSSRFAYDRMNRLTQSVNVVGSVTSVVGSVYDLSGNRTRVVYPGGLTVTNTFDAANRLAAVQDWAGRTATYTYDAMHSPTGTLHPNGVVGALARDEAQRLTRVTYSTNGTAFVDRVYTLDAVGNRTAEDVNAGLSPSLTPSMRRFAQDAADRVTSIGGKTHPDSPAWTNSTPVWDANGNMLSDGLELTVAYDIEKRATNLQSSALGNRAFFYDGRGGVVKRTVNGTNYVDVLDGNRLLLTRSASGTVLAYYVWGNGLIARIDTNGVALFVHADGQGNVLAMTGTSGQVTDHWFYSPYGTVLNRTGSTDTPFQWLGGYGVRYEGGDLYRTQYRFHHAGLMRFTSVDPIGLAGGANLFAYCMGNPLALIDPDGKCGTQNRIEFNMPGYGAAQSYQIVGGNVRNLTVSDIDVAYDIGVTVAQGMPLVGPAYRAGTYYGSGHPVLGTVNLVSFGIEAVPVFYGARAAASAMSPGVAVATETTTAISPFRYTQPGETWTHYGYVEQSGNYAGGLKPGGFASPVQGLSGAEARSGLALPGSRPLPNATYTVTPNPVTPIRVNPTTRPDYGQLGGLPEVEFYMGTGPGTISGPTLIP